MKQLLHTFLSCWATLLIMGISLTHVSAADEPAPLLKVTAAIDDKEQDHTPVSFHIALRVENVSLKPQFVQAMSCSWWENWKPDHPHLTAGGWDCAKNTQQTIYLAPGGYFTDELEISADATFKGAASFRMGFDPGNGGKTVWSNEVKVNIDPTIKPAPAPAGWLSASKRTFGPGSRIK